MALRVALSGLLAAVLLGVAAASAQTAEERRRGQRLERTDLLIPGETLQDRFERRTDGDGIRIGKILATGQAEAGARFDDNIFADTFGRRADLISQIGGKAAFNYKLDRFDATLQTGLNGNFYLDNDTEDYWTGLGRLTLRNEVHSDLELVGAGGVQRLIVPRDEPNGINGLEPAVFKVYDASLGAIVGGAGRFSVTTDVGFNLLEFDPVPSLGGSTIDTAERNRLETFINVRADYRSFGKQGVYVQVRGNNRDYERDLDNSGFNRSSSGVLARVGATADIDDIFLLGASIGVSRQDYDDRRIGTITEPDAQLQAIWNVTRLTQIAASYVHEFAESIFIDSPGFVRDRFLLSVDHELRRHILLTAGVSLDRRDLEQRDRVIDIYGILARIQYELTPGLLASADYTFAHQSGSLNTQEYDRNAVTVRLRRVF